MTTNIYKENDEVHNIMETYKDDISINTITHTNITDECMVVIHVRNLIAAKLYLSRKSL
jgi:hypothetical protein